MAEPTMQEVHEAVQELKTRVESGKAIDQEVLEKINNTLDAQETKNQELITAQKASETSMEEFKQRVETLEAELSTKSTQSVHWRDSEEYRELKSFLVSGDVVAESKTLRTDSNEDGGFLIQGEFDNQILKNIVEISNIRSISRVRTVGSKTLTMPKRSSIPVATFEGELESGGDSTSKYASEQMNTWRQTFTTPVSRDMLMDSSYNMESEIMTDAGQAFAFGEGNKFVLGTGVKQPEGFLVNADLVAGAYESASAGTLTADDMILLTGELKSGYNPVYVMNRRTLAFLRTLKSTDGNLLWQPGLNGGVANTINGFNYILADDMPDIAAGSLSVAFGDFQRGYQIVDRLGLTVIRDEYALKKQAAVEFTFMRYVNGKVVLPEAIKLLLTKT